MEGTVSGRGRVSMYRGIFTGLARPEESFTGLTRHAKPNTNASVLAANTLFVATTARGSTGSFTVLPLHRTGLIAANEPHICTNEVSNGAPPSPVRDLAFNPFNEQVVASAGRAISLWKIPKKGLVADLVDPLLTLQDACAGELSSTKLIRFHPTTPNILVSASIDNSFRLWDVDACKALLKTSFGMVTNVVWDSLGAEFLVSSSVTDVKLCDPRQKQFDGVNFPGTARHTGFFVTGDSSTFVTVELRYSNIIKLWDSRSVGTELGSLKLQAESSHLHLPLYDRDGKLLYIPDKSDRKLSVFELSTQEPLIRALRTSQASTAVKAFTMLPRRALKVADCEVGRILRLTAEGIQPMSFYVPRIHEAFQEDLYPPTFCGQPSQTAKQWWDEHTTNIPVVDSLLGEYQSTLGATRVDEVNLKALESGAYTDDEFMGDDADDGKAGSLRGSIFEDEEVPPKIAFGTPMLKFGKNGATREKRVWIEDERHICWDGALISPKWGKKCSVDLYKALRIQKGQMTTKFDRETKYFGVAKNTAFSIIYIDEQKEKSLDFIAQNRPDFELWFSTISKILIRIRSLKEATALTTRFLQHVFELADVDKSNSLDRSEVRGLLKHLCITCPKQDIEDVFLRMKSEGSKALSFEQFSSFIINLRRRFDLEILWSRLIEDRIEEHVTPLLVQQNGGIHIPFAHENDTLSLEKFTEFWVSTTLGTDGKLEDTKAEAIHLLKLFMGSDYSSKDLGLSYYAFYKLMNSEINDAYSPALKTQYQDMTLPLSYYYMYSSHNTYLESDQIIGKSSVNRYINDLLRGVRCVELDTWDGPDGNPVIKHGGTLTSSIKFVDVVKAIRTFGFVTSPYPVVLSIENHCSQAQQRRMAIMMRGLFGDMLMEADSELYSRPDVLLRSPADLRNKILVKGSRPKNATVDLPEDEDYDDDEDGEEQCTYSDDENSADDKDFNEDDSSGIPPTIQRSSLERDIVMSSTSGGPVGRRVKSVRDASNPAPALSRQVSQFSTASSDSAVSRTSKVSRSSASTTSSISSALGLVKEKPHEFLSSITYLATCKVLTFDKEYSRSIPADHISSFKESKTEKHVRKRAQGWIEHNKTHLSRIYPEGTRIDSSNYDPMPAWSVGAQVIALNTQTHDIPNVLNDGLFRHNGGCGYVLKPDYLLYEEFKLSPPLVINVNVISGQHIPRLKGSLAFPSPIIEIGINGLGGDTCKYRTNAVRENGFDPIWDEVFTFNVNKTDLAQLTFQVLNDDSILGMNRQAVIASASIPLACLRPGFRIVRLYDENGRNDFDFAFATLFVHITKIILG